MNASQPESTKAKMIDINLRAIEKWEDIVDNHCSQTINSIIFFTSFPFDSYLNCLPHFEIHSGRLQPSHRRYFSIMIIDSIYPIDDEKR